ncbi:MAG: hypothetical protein MI725_13670 [Pirellulales bacterium]|nr:hypothetical protein [Pirellulales bacterium]
MKLTSATYWRPSEQNIHRMPGDTEADPWGVKPNPGLEVVLDQQEHRQWQQYRSRRDLLGNPRGKALVQQLDEQYGQLPETFRDRALDRAVEYLQDQLKHESR